MNLTDTKNNITNDKDDEDEDDETAAAYLEDTFHSVLMKQQLARLVHKSDM